jgi:SAM-dependent MidA family methyltransferase
MEEQRFEIQSKTLFSKSLIWGLNRRFYKKQGVDAWRSNTVPHHLTSNAVVGKVYAELIFGVLNDLAIQNKTEEKVYFLELGAGHGRLGFLVLLYLERLIAQTPKVLPPYCYVLSDIVEDNLQFFVEHPQFQSYLERGLLDICHFDAESSTSLDLRQSKVSIKPSSLVQPLIVLANYFFDSIPSELFYIKDQKISLCSVSLNTPIDTSGLQEAQILEQIDLEFHIDQTNTNFYPEAAINTLLEEYRKTLSHTFLFFPYTGMRCIRNLENLSKNGIILLSLDKGFRTLKDIDQQKAPEMIVHGSMSFWVNYHALAKLCQSQNGEALFPSFSTFHLQLGCLFFLTDANSYSETKLAYYRFVDNFGPDDYNGFKRFAFQYISRMTLVELIGMIRLSACDSTFFINILPRLKQVIQKITVNERHRLKQVLDETWMTYFTLKESYDLAFEIGGILYTLGYYESALEYFDRSINIYGHKPDEFYNRVLCHYQLREDQKFVDLLKSAKLTFPNYERWKELELLDLQAE